MLNKISVYERIMNAKWCEELRKGSLKESSQQACPDLHRLLGRDSHWDDTWSPGRIVMVIWSEEQLTQSYDLVLFLFCVIEHSKFSGLKQPFHCAYILCGQECRQCLVLLCDFWGRLKGVRWLDVWGQESARSFSTHVCYMSEWPEGWVHLELWIGYPSS